MAGRRSDADESYKLAIAALNGLQTNASVLEEIRRTGDQNPGARLAAFRQCAEGIGLQGSRLDQLNAIHVTGTKGKGSVCAFCESILRQYGLKTGFYSSPHLLEVRERIRLNGRPLSRQQFAKYFWECYNLIEQFKNQDTVNNGTVEDLHKKRHLPSYFQFLTLMAFHVFLQEKIDVAVVEVGIGGTYDSTNIIPNPVVCAISSIGYDHMDILGDTLSKIAWNKGGICKPGRPVFTVAQPADAMSTLIARAVELKASSIQVSPDLSSYLGHCPELGLAGDHQRLNATLSAQVCRRWLKETGHWKDNEEFSMQSGSSSIAEAEPFDLPQQFYQGFKSCYWPGRNEVLKGSGVTYYIDGAHTPESLEACTKWFKQVSTQEAQEMSVPVTKVLLFNTTGRRNTHVLLTPLLDCGIKYAAFCPNIADLTATSGDQLNSTTSFADQLHRARINERAWVELQLGLPPHSLTPPTATDGQSMGQAGPGTCSGTATFDCIAHALHWVTGGRLTVPSSQLATLSPPPSPTFPQLSEAAHIQVLVTGSLHLVGGVMGLLGAEVDSL